MQTSAPPTFVESEFRKATRSEPEKSCVRVARRDGWVAIRDDKVDFGSAEDHRLLLSEAAFDEALSGWREGQDAGPVTLRPGADELLTMRLTGEVGPVLAFTAAEVSAFLDGVVRGEFDACAYA